MRDRVKSSVAAAATRAIATAGPAFLFDLDGTLVDSVYQHVLAWREALEKAGIELSVWRIHRRVGMSGGLVCEPAVARNRPPIGKTEGRGYSAMACRSVRTHGDAGASPARCARAPRLSLQGRNSVGHRKQRKNGKRRAWFESSRC